MNELKEFMQGVKAGDIRSNFVQEKVADNVLVELSVGPFQNGYINFRIFVDDERIDAEKGMYYRRLYAIDDKYKTIHKNVRDCIEEENECEVRNDHEWAATTKSRVKKHPALPEFLDTDSTVLFEYIVRLREDVSILEALKTNRRD